MANISLGTTALAFTFSTQTLRVLMIDGEPWFVASDVCDALSIAQTASAMRQLDDDEKGVHSTHTPGGEQKVTIINESGLYSLILTSRKPEAKKFKKWVTSEVLPAIRKTGRYEAPAHAQQYASAERLSGNDFQNIRRIVWSATAPPSRPCTSPPWQPKSRPTSPPA
jgi:prophage antirepressor-like protein